MNRVALKERAKNLLGNKIFGEQWMMMLLVVLVYQAVVNLAGSLLAGIGTLVLAGPMAYGMYSIFLQKARTDEKVKIENLFKGFEDFGENLLLGLMQTLFILLWSLLFIVPGIIKAYAYSMCFYIKVDHPSWDWKQCLEESQRITNGHKMDLFVLDLSFIGWVLVCMLTFGIGSLWLAPYQQMTHTLYYEELKASI